MYVIIAIIAAGFALFYCSYQIRLGAYVRSLCRNRAAGHVVALTFDDGPDPEQTPRVLDTLRAHGVRATFFLIGTQSAFTRGATAPASRCCEAGRWRPTSCGAGSRCAR